MQYRIGRTIPRETTSPAFNAIIGSMVSQMAPMSSAFSRLPELNFCLAEHEVRPSVVSTCGHVANRRCAEGDKWLHSHRRRAQVKARRPAGNGGYKFSGFLR